MTVIYIDLLFVLNLIANYLLLLGTGRVAGAVLRRLRIVLAASVGALYAVIAFMPAMKWLALWPCRFLFGVLMPLIAYGGERRLLRIIALFFAAAAGLAGGVLAVEMLGGTDLTIENQVLYSEFDLRLLLLLFVAGYAAMSLFFRRLGRHMGRELVRLEIVLLGKKTELTALLDSGHTLTDPTTNRPVIVADARCLSHILPSAVDSARPVEAMKWCQAAGVSGVRLIPYRTVGVDCGMLLALQSDSVKLKEKRLGKLLIALSPNPVDDGGGYQALIGGIEPDV